MQKRNCLKSSLRKFSTNIKSTTDFYILCKRGGYHDFSFNFFCLTVPKNFVGEHFGVTKIFRYRKILRIREGGITFLRRKLIVSQYRKISFWNTSVHQNISGIEKFYASERGEGGIKFLRRKLFVTQYQKISFGNTSVFQKISCIAKFYA